MNAFPLHLMRHGAPQLAGRLLGHLDAPPEAEGIALCIERARHLDFARVVTSDLARARAPGAVIAAERGIELDVDRRWRELNFGDWEGADPALLPAEDLARFWDDPDGFPPPGGESWTDLRADRGRAGRAWRAGVGGLPCRGDTGGVGCAVRFRRAAGLGGGPALWRGAEPAGLAGRAVGTDYGPDRMKRLVLALQLMTRLPLPAQDVDEGDFAAAIRWLPATGIAVGLVVAGGAGLGMRIDPWAGALFGLVAWVAVTGALHLDGLGDIADAAGAAHGDRSRLSAVLADPHIGSFGVVAIGLQLAAKLVLLRLWLESFPPWMLAAVAMVARIGPLFWTRWLPPLHEGLASRFRAGWRAEPFILWSILGLALGYREPALLAAIPLIPLWGLWLRSRIGGISGDGHGAGIELLESALLLAMAVAR